MLLPKYAHLPSAPLIPGEITDRQIRAWMAWQHLKDREERARYARAGLFPMSGGGEVALRRTQAAIETTRGTNLAATRRVYGSGAMAKDLPFVRPENEDRTSFIENFRGQTGLVKATFPFKASATYDDLAWWFQLGLKGGVTATLTNVAVQTYLFVPTATTDDIKSATFEWGDDTQAFKGNFGMLDTFDITGAMGAFWSCNFNVLLADMATATFTAAIADRTGLEDVHTHLSKFALGAAGATPSSYMTGRFIGFKFTANNGLSPKYFADGTSAAALYTGMGRKTRMYTLEATMEGNAATITERGVWEAGTQRVARITATGSTIATSSPPTGRSVDLIMPGMWNAYPVGARDTNTIFTGTMEANYDTVLAYDLSVAVANQLATLP